MRIGAVERAVMGWILTAGAFAGQIPRMPMPVEYENSAEYSWLNKKVLEARTLDDMSDPSRWSLRGLGRVSFPETGAGPRVARVQMDLRATPADAGPTAAPSATLVRAIPGEDWSRFNRLYFRVRPQMSGFHVLTLTVTMRSDGVEKTPDVYRREGGHYITVANHRWTDIAWEITPVARDKVTSLEFNCRVPKRLAGAGDSVSFEIGPVELQRVEPDHYEGWNVAPGKISFSHTGYLPGLSKTALASGLAAREFTLVDADTGESVLRKPVRTIKTRLGEFQQLDFSEVRRTGRYFLRAGDLRTRPFRIDPDVWRPTIVKTINFFFGERCGMDIPGIHEACHRDWQATLGDLRIVMNGGWHDAGDLSQGLVNTGESVYAMLALAARLKAAGGDPAVVSRLLEEARWGLDWVLKVRFPGGYRIGFASMNTWTNGIIGDADDRPREALNNPNVNYLAASAEALAHNVLKDSHPDLAARCLRTAEEDWQFAIEGQEIPETQHTPAFAATEMELASVGILASMELFQATGHRKYADKARELAKLVLDSQQKSYVGPDFPLAGFFYTSPARSDIFHQFHRGNDQAPIVALSRLCDAFPGDPDWIRWYAAVALYSEYQKKVAETTQPWGVLPAYVYRDDEWQKAVDGDRYQSNREAYREQVLNGMPMGAGYYLKAFPVWFGRRGNYGVLLAQAKGLAAAARLRRDEASLDLAARQLEWVVGRNPFVQSTMWGEGYDFAQQYSVSSGDFVGSLPVGMMTRANRDLPYWPPQNSYVYKEVWVHSSARWLWLLEDLVGGMHHPDPPPGQALDFSLSQETDSDGDVTIRLSAKGAGEHTFAIRADNLTVGQPTRNLDLKPGKAGTLTWKGRMKSLTAPWVAVVIPDDDLSRRRDLVGRASRRGR